VPRRDTFPPVWRISLAISYSASLWAVLPWPTSGNHCVIQHAVQNSGQLTGHYNGRLFGADPLGEPSTSGF
jgi:hypothetical protein